MLKWMMLVLYILFIAYILWRSIHSMRRIHPLVDKKRVMIPYAVLFVAICSSLLLGGLLPPGKLSTALHKFSNYWLAFFIFMLFFILVADIINLILRLVNKKWKVPYYGTTQGHRIVSSTVLILTLLFTGYGLIHANKLVTNSYEITVEKNAGELKDLNVVLIADFHLGYSIDKENMKEMVEEVNALNPDIVLVAGDIVDNNYEAISDPEETAEIISGIKSKYGCYAVYGNHDVAETLIGGFPITPYYEAFRDPRVVEFVEKCGFKMLEDDSVLIDNSFYVTGRIDAERAGDGTKNRMETSELIEELDQSKPIIVLSHEPDELDENAEAGVDVLLCGHTHAGQFFPLTLVQPLAWRNYWGYLKVGNMHNFVTSGIGVYGPDVRITTDSEVMQIKMHFE